MVYFRSNQRGAWTTWMRRNRRVMESTAPFPLSTLSQSAAYSAYTEEAMDTSFTASLWSDSAGAPNPTTWRLISRALYTTIGYLVGK